MTVFTTAPGGGTTTALTFTINANTSPVPQITSISPSTTFTSNPGFTLLVTGTDFVLSNPRYCEQQQCADNIP